MDSSEKNTEFYRLLNENKFLEEEVGKLGRYDAVAAFNRFQSKIDNPKTVKLNNRKYWNLGIAASLALCISVFFGIYKYNDIRHKQFSTEMAFTGIATGGNRAVLILSNGRKIDLITAKNGELAKEAGIKISKMSDGNLIYMSSESGESQGGGDVFNTVMTPRGGQYQVGLPDGTKVWLNAQSSIKFSANLATQNSRNVELTGEAYFEVAKRIQQQEGPGEAKRVPFIVTTPNQTIEVLGTRFNINSYFDEPIARTTLLQGKLKVSKNNAGNAVLLKPGQESAIGHSNDAIKVSAVDADEAIAWKNGDFAFNNENLGSIMRKLSRWYNVDVEFSDERKKAVIFGGYIPRSSSISKVLKMLEMTDLVKFTIENNKVIVH
ncbi:FecR family protein [Pedobacter sp. V48]|uniref:FecR family protein n=1 Tax=Pedobacter sp. V48 TaxID=509635 RepID=UPI0003E50E1B|nr:FecR family protein [Pedobacter sp. V48]ETZ22426.1 hypothetical protein N824_01895 [Pedobacter sp. V48]